MKIPGYEIQDKSTSIWIKSEIEEISSQDDGDESDKHLEARDCRYSRLKCHGIEIRMGTRLNYISDL